MLAVCRLSRGGSDLPVDIPRARVYKLTAVGRKKLGVETESWTQLTAAIGRVLEQLEQA